MAKRVYIEGESYGPYHSMWQGFGWRVVNHSLDADVIQFTGGEDVDPALYDEVPHPTTLFNRQRDELCMNLFMYAQDNDIPMAGICRGGQFLNVMNGGKMFQDCDGHGIWGTHKALIQETGVKVQVTSTHHQIMRPHESGIVLMESERLGTYKEHMGLVLESYWGAIDQVEASDVEAVFYPNTKSLCFQPHPEYCESDSDCQKTYRYFLRNHLELDV